MREIVVDIFLSLFFLSLAFLLNGALSVWEVLTEESVGMHGCLEG